MRNVIQVFEHETLRVGTDGFEASHFDGLARYYERHCGRFFELGYQRIHFAQYVGVVQVGNLTIEVLPKTEREDMTDKGKWHNALIEMLHRCGYLRLESVSDAHLRLRHATLFDLYVETFLKEVEDVLHRGLARKYRRIHGNLPALKGRLMFGEHLKRNMIHRERFYTSHQCYDIDNPWNCILKQALQIVSRTSKSHFLSGTAERLLLSFENVADTRASAETFSRLQFDRSTERYRRGIGLAELIIRNFTPDVQTGTRDVTAILFDMNELFERYVYAMLKRAQSQHPGITVKPQQSRRFWTGATASTHIRPDIVVTMESNGGSRPVILDTKWKAPAAGRPSDADLRQMYAYNRQFGATEAYLVYPSTRGQEKTWGQYAREGGAVVAPPHGCGLWFINLFDETGHLNQDMGTAMLDCLQGAVTLESRASI